MAASSESKMSAAAAAAAAPQQPTRAGNSSDLDSEVQSNKPLFLNFTAELAPFSASKKQKKKSNVYKVSGVNILNRNSVDSKTALERLQRRRENHNFVERRRRDNINHTITTLSTLIPYCAEDGVKLNKGSILHMAVEYIQDLQDINAALAEENIRLGGSGNIPLPSRRPSEDSKDISTAPQSPMEDEEMLESASVSPRIAPSSDKAATAGAVESTPSSRAPSDGHPSPSSSSGKSKSKKAHAAKDSRKGSGAQRAILPARSAAGASAGAISPPTTTADPSAAPSAAPSTTTSPMALAATVSAVHTRSIPPVPQLPPTSVLAQQPAVPTVGSTLLPPPPSASVPHSPAAGIAVQQGTHQQQHQGNGYVPSITPMLPPIGPTASSSRLSPTAAAPGAHAATLPPPPPQAQFQFPHAAMHYASKPPAQSMPNSPNFQSYTGGRLSSDFSLGQRAANNSSAIGSHPFFTNGGTHDIPSIRHHLHASSGSKQSGVYSPPNGQHQQLSPAYQQQQNAAGLPVRKNSFNPQQYRQHPYAQNSPAHVPVAQSLQNTPLMRPSRESLLGEGFELPPINFNNRIVLPPPQQQQQQQGQQGQQQQR